MKHGAIALSICFVVFASAMPQANPPLPERPTADEIMKQALARANTQHQSLVEATFESEVVSTTKSLDDKNNAFKTEWTRRRQYPLNGALFEETVEKNGKPLSRGDLRNEEKKKDEFVRQVSKRVSRGEHPQPEKEPGIRFNHEFVDRYRLKKTGVDMVGDYRCWVIAFEPKEGKLPVRNRMDNALNQSTGRFWISQEDHGLARVEFALGKPFKYWGGFLAVIRNTDGRMEYRRVEPDIWLPVSFDLKLDLEIMMMKDIRRHITINWSNYRRAAGVPGRSKTAQWTPSR